MSTKDLIDRLESNRPAAKAQRAPEPKPAEPKASDSTTRVGSSVVRRRPANEPPPPPPPAAPRTIRRPAATVAPEQPARSGAPHASGGASSGGASSGGATPQSARPAAAYGRDTTPFIERSTPRRPGEPADVRRARSDEGRPDEGRPDQGRSGEAQRPAAQAATPPVAARAETPPPIANEPSQDSSRPEMDASPAAEHAAEASSTEPAREERADAPPSTEVEHAARAAEPVAEAAPKLDGGTAPAAEQAARPDAGTHEPAAEAPAAAPVPEAPPAPRHEPTLERAVIIDRPGGTARLASAQPTSARPAGQHRLPDAPILPGLGRAVVSLPAGYDPTDPTGARRRAREQAAQGNRWGPGSGPPGADRRPPMPGRTDAGPPPAADSRDRKKGRRGERSELVMSEVAGEGRARRNKRGPAKAAPRPAQVVKRRVRIDAEITVANLAHEMGVKVAELIKLLMSMGQPATANQVVDFDTATLLAQELGHEVVNVAFSESDHFITEEEEEEGAEFPIRAPVVTVMGHVDHGKTTLLDTVRKAKVAAGEAGGITQHVGAYQVKRGDRAITFIDTPGHAAFSAMRARGAKATDIVILVVAADDGVMPQTIEAISHAKAANVPIVVAINKMDKPGVQPERIKQLLMEHGLVPEEFGGETMMVPISALKGTGVDDLLDNVLLTAEIGDYRANPDRHAEGVVLESRLETGRGAVASLLVQTGTLKQGDTLVIGHTWGRVRAMSDDRGAKIKEAGPSTPVEIIGLQDIPSAGDDFVVVESEKDARALVEHRTTQASRASLAMQRSKMTVEDLYKTGADAGKILHLVLKTDVSGSLEALRGALEGQEIAGTTLKILHSAIGPVNESDINLAAANNSLVVAFAVKADAKARQAADQYGVEIKRYDIIYNVLDDVKARMEGMLEPIYEEQRVGEAEVRALFKIPRIGFIAGCMVVDGKVTRNAAARVLRDGKEIFEGKVTSLKRFKEDVKEVERGFECGIGVEGATDLKEGDRIVISSRVQVPRT